MFFFFKQKTAYEMRISDWSSDVCSSDLLASLVDDELELGATVIDMGGGATTIAVFYEHNVIFTDVIPVGGNHVTSDIARGLSTPLVHAERMKTLYGHVITAPTDERELIDVPQVGEDDSSHSQQIPRSLLEIERAHV